jgi:hypothetical protein
VTRHGPPADVVRAIGVILRVPRSSRQWKMSLVGVYPSSCFTQWTTGIGKDSCRRLKVNSGRVLRSARQTVKYQTVPGQLHGFTRLEAQDLAIAAVLDWSVELSHLPGSNERLTSVPDQNVSARGSL